MPGPRVRSAIRPVVAVAATDVDTVGSIASYLDAASVDSAVFTDITEVVAAPAGTVVFILFPDGFRWEEVVLALATIREEHSSALPVIVTSAPRRYEALTLGDRVLVVPRSTWGWSILDGIRFHISHARRAVEAMAAPPEAL